METLRPTKAHRVILFIMLALSILALIYVVNSEQEYLENSCHNQNILPHSECLLIAGM